MIKSKNTAVIDMEEAYSTQRNMWVAYLLSLFFEVCMANRKNFAVPGQVFGRLTVVSEGKKQNKNNKYTYWVANCLCECGNRVQIPISSLFSGATKSCGCYNADGSCKPWTTHRLSGKHVYKVWKGMMWRCYHSKSSHYHSYGGRGITVCNRWHDPVNFFGDMNSSYKKGLQIDRINNNGNYEPGNCRWVTQSVNMRNTRVNHMIEFDGEVKCCIEWAEKFNIDPMTVKYRAKHNIPLNKPVTWSKK